VEDRFRGFAYRLAALGCVVDGGQRQTVSGVLQIFFVFEDGDGPLDSLQHLGCANTSVVIGIDQVQRALVEFNAARRTGERRPQLLVERL
jgi:hypothetical protein